MKDHHDILVFPKDVDINYVQAIIDYASDNDVTQIEAKKVIDERQKIKKELRDATIRRR